MRSGLAALTLALAALPAAASPGPQEEPAGARFTQEQIRSARLNPAAFEIAEVSIENLGPAQSIQDFSPPVQEPPPAPDDGGIDLGSIVNIAKKFWDIIKENEAVLNVSKDYAAAVPEGIARWDRLSGWKAPEGTVYAFRALNKFKAEVIHVRYQVVRTYGGGWRGPDGVRRGRYLTGVTVEPLFVDVGWGYRLDMSVRVPTVVNAGETEEDPLAAMTVNLEWRIATPMQKTQGTGVYYVRGDGLFKEIGGPFVKGYTKAAPRALERAKAGF